jgi:hypothetical protein
MNPEYLGAYSLEDGKDIVLTIDYIKVETVTGTDGKKEDLPVCHWKEPEKSMILNATNMKMIAKVLNSNFVEDWSGKKVQIGTEKVRAFGDVVDALRIRRYAPKQTSTAHAELVCADCGKPITDAYGMSAAQVADSTAKKYGRPLCADCATAAAGKAK